MAPTKTSHALEDPDFSLFSMHPPPSLEASEDMIPLHPSAAEHASANDSDSPSSDSSPSPSRKPTTSRSRAKKARKAAHRNQNSKPSLRPAKDVLSRIRHDPSLHESDFVVGYIDRHAPEMMEMDVSAWKGGVADVTDEEWIPQHRIMYFRKKGDGEGRRVWDRATRLDRLFGSGVALVPALEEVREGKKPKEDEVGVAADESEDGGNAHVMSENDSS
ncbi:hypothetical protein HO133_000824 [Letharia lupina]|uniref:MJ1316 RNA cyclic group end recognition domain-containing protein n=1 Tax=Letharia lupina TaxID=560253 RepID=A0A8H6CGF5_9LECA|nr:uncharacterized protein HO133_000824 [Letharia lupina]KAF6222776.1 hypothetical protein HO133_000824 [Letharia lupina]